MTLYHIALWSPDERFDDYSLNEKINEITKCFLESYLLMKSMTNLKEKDHFYVFLCPEWTFIDKKSSLSNKCYTKDDFEKIVEAFTKLSASCPDALIFAGSIRLLKEFNIKKLGKYGALFTKEAEPTLQILSWYRLWYINVWPTQSWS
jgi:hypothetical protein